MNNYCGLNDEEVRERIKNKQVNKIEDSSRSYREIIYGNIFTFFNLINLILFSLIFFIKAYKNGLFIITVICNILVGLYQEIKAKKILDKLKIINQAKVEVIRNNQTKIIPGDEIVLDDLILLKASSQAMVDILITEGEMEVDEALLTGESDNVIKKVDDIILSGSLLIGGKAVGKVIRVGNESYGNTIVKEAKSFKKQHSELRLSIDRILKVVSVLIVPVGLLMFYNQMYVNNSGLNNSIITVVAAMVGMIPEGLVFLISIALAISSIRLSKINTLVQQLFGIETLARVDTICFDKTGTLTNNKMKVKKVINYSSYNIEDIIGSFNRVFSEGNATNNALKDYFGENNLYKESEVVYFSSSRKYSSITFDDLGTIYLGAYQNLCFDEEVVKEINTYTKEGYRVLCLSKLAKDKSVALAIIIIEDELRDNAEEIIDYFYTQEVNVKVISGDDPVTVSNLAKKVKIRNYNKYLDLSKVSDEELVNKVEDTVIFGRVKPYQKKLIVKTLQFNKHVVAMSGDGINDVLALKQADVGISVFSGSDGAKNVSEIILMDDDFSHMSAVVNEGRRVINNINKAACMFLIKTIFSSILAVAVILFNFNYPFIPIQLTIISAFCVGIPTTLLQLESDFNRVKDNFIKNVFVNTVPSALMIVLGIIAFLIFKVNNTVIVLYTAILYCFTLFKVYKADSTYKKAIIYPNIILLGISIVVFKDYLGLDMLANMEYLGLLIAVLWGILILKIIDRFVKK